MNKARSDSIRTKLQADRNIEIAQQANKETAKEESQKESARALIFVFIALTLFAIASYICGHVYYSRRNL
jgi:hypothetical protein